MPPLHRRPRIEELDRRDVPAILFGVTTTDRLVTFDSASPGTFLTDVAITGITAGQEIEAIDFSPGNGSLFLITTGGGQAHFYFLNPSTGVVTARVPHDIPSFGSFTGTDLGFDFNPVTNRPRLVSNADENYVFTVNLPSPTQETNLAYVAGDPNAGVNPNVVALAYNANSNFATSTTLFGVDSGRNALVRIGSVGGNPDGAGTGKLTTIGAGLGVDTTERVGFDIADGTVSTAFASLTAPGATRSALHRINLNTGVATSIGVIGPTTNVFLRDLAVALVGHFTLSTTPITAGEAAGSVVVTVNRSVPSQVAATVNVEVLSGTATTGTDFTLTGLPLAFGVGETSKTFTVNLVNDTTIEANETLVFRLTGATNGASTDASQAVTLTIADDDAPPPPPLPPPPPPPPLPTLVTRKRKRGLRTRVQVLDGGTGLVMRELGPFTGRVKVLSLDANGDGILDVVVQFLKRGKKRRQGVSGADFALLPA